MANVTKGEQLYEGKAKKVFATSDPDLVIVDYKDDATAGDGAKKGTIKGKGVINNQMTNVMFQMLEKEGVPTHFVEELSERETLVKKVSIVPLEVIVRNVAAGNPLFWMTPRFGNVTWLAPRCLYYKLDLGLAHRPHLGFFF